MEMPSGWKKLRRSLMLPLTKAGETPQIHSEQEAQIDEALELMREMAQALDKTLSYYGYLNEPDAEPIAPGLYDALDALNKFKEWK